MKKQTIVGMMAASIAAGTVLVAAAAEINFCDNGIWPKTACDSKGAPAPEFSEWFTDVPWRQKLGTYTGNKIDQAIVLPYDVLRDDAKKACANVRDPVTGAPRPLTQEQCMIEIGVTNIVGTLRTDTKYDPDDPKIKAAKIGDTPYCQDPKLPCIEVKLEVSNWWAQPSGGTLVPGVNTLNKQLYGTELDVQNYPAGFVLSDATVYAPQMPWYMTHYCQSRWKDDSQDPVCYADYFGTFNSAFNGNGNGTWPTLSGFSVSPAATYPGAPGNHCKDKLDKCTIALAAFDLTPVPSDPAKLQFQPYNDYLIRWFNRALASFPDQVTPAERQRHFAWTTTEVKWEDFVYPQALHNPFQGAYPAKDKPAGSCDTTFENNNGCPQTGQQPAQQFLYPRQCSLDDLAGAAKGDLTKVARLRNCSLAYETHPNGFLWQWSDPATGADYGADFVAASMKGNQYGRTSFLFAGVPGMQVPVTFLKDAKSESGLTLYEQVYNASIFSMYLPVANVADFKNAYVGRNYKSTEFYHALLMSNHNESDPWQFADGIRGKVLWHNEYRMTGMYDKRNERAIFRDRMFAASFNPANAKAPFHNETCDGCHVRNGSGIPINTAGKLDPVLREFMSDVEYSATGLQGKYPKQTPAPADYTFTGKIRPMKLIFLDLRRDAKTLDASRYSEPLATPAAVVSTSPSKVEEENLYYNNKIMNYFGDSFHVTNPSYSYSWTYETYEDAKKAGKPDRRVVKVDRVNAELKKTYLPMQIKLGQFLTPSSCQIAPPETRTTKPWPANCNDVNGDAITAAIAKGEVGYMHLNGKRLGNLSAMEAIPNSAITGFQDAQSTKLGSKLAGEIIWNAGSRDGYKGTVRKDCKSRSTADCFIGRFGWIGDRASLEDQVANAAFVEMNMTTKEGYDWLYPDGGTAHPIRYAHPNCGPANKACKDSKGNADLTERDVERMADYARWLGNPTRSEFKVGLPEVIEGEKIFRKLGCDTCHVVRRIDIVPNETMLNKDFRDRLATRIKAATGIGPASVPFLSYIGTDLLMHDMGYLSQVADAKESIRDNNGVILPKYKNYMQKIRTPALKGLGLNRFVTDSYRNTKTWIDDDTSTLDAACDFLLHDGRACDAIEAAFLHDGPAVDKLGLIPKMNALPAKEIGYLRAFLYSL